MKALVLGGSGFIGSHLVDRLLGVGAEVSVLDMSHDPFVKERKNITFFHGSLSEKSLLKQALQGIDIVFHLVSTTVPSTANKNMEFDIHSNLIATVSLLNIMKEVGTKRIVYLSSGGTVYGNPQSYPIPENHSLDPISSYGIVKVAIEKYLYLFEQLHGFQTLILRPSNAYGPRQKFTKKQGVIAHFLYHLLLDEPIELWGDGTIRRDYIHVQDLVDLMMTGMSNRITGVFNAGSGEDVSLTEIIDSIEKVSGKKFIVNQLPGRDYDVKKVRLDIGNTEKAFNWTPSVTLKDGIKEQYLWMKRIVSKKNDSTARQRIH